MTQQHTSAATSINSKKVPALFNKIAWKQGQTNIDIGGGKYNTAIDHLSKYGAINIIYDPYNRSEEENKQALSIARNGVDSVSISNVLNVIQELECRQQVIQTAYDALHADGTCYITVYEGNGNGQGKETTKGWQEHRKLNSYLIEVQQIFPTAYTKNGMIIAKKA